MNELNDKTRDMARRGEITKEMKLTEWTVNAFENYRFLKDHPAPHLGEYLKKCSGPCFILGSGPSLDDAYEPIKRIADGNTELKKAPIFSGPSQAMGVAAHGVTPEYIVGHDSHPLNFDYLRPDVIDWGEATLICHPSYNPRTVQFWKGKRIMFRLTTRWHDSMIDDTGLTIQGFMDKYKPDPDTPISWYLRDEYILFMRNSLLRAFPEIPFGVMSASCTPIQCLYIADAMGYDPIYLVANDNCFMDGKSRADAYRWNTIAESISFAGAFRYDKKATYLIKSNGLDTTEQLEGYRKGTILVSASLSAAIYEVYAKRPGILNFFPAISWNDLEAGNVPAPLSGRERIEKIEKWKKEEE